MVLGGIFKYSKLASSLLEMNAEIHSDFKEGKIGLSPDFL